jgi:hypothetical protein
MEVAGEPVSAVAVDGKVRNERLKGDLESIAERRDSLLIGNHLVVAEAAGLA